MERKISITLDEYSSMDELLPADRELLEQAQLASKTAYAPYSSFQVGAAVRLTDGSLFRGSNQENAAYPSGQCAERVALFYAQSQAPDVPVDAIAVYAHSNEFKLDEPVTPCGSCRQVMAEYENRHARKIRIIMGNSGSIRIINGIEGLLPLMFMLEKLKR
jgi:cytidine deaminase